MQNDNINRRLFIKTIGLAGIGAAAVKAEPNNANSAGSKDKKTDTILPQRILGKTGENVPVLALGTMFNLVEKQIILRKAYNSGVTYWDTAYSYAGGNSELGIGKFFKANPDLRKNIFLTSKASGATKENNSQAIVKVVEERLQESLKRMNTDHIDLYYGVHGMSEPERELFDELGDWAANAKKRGLIRYFGFTTHSNMSQCLMAASKVDWIDAIMTSFNFRLMLDKELLDAIDACSKKNIGLVAMKVMAKKVDKGEELTEFVEHFTNKGFTEGQAKIKAVLTDERFATACVGMESIEKLTLNVAAVQDKTKISAHDMKFIKQYALQDCGGYCAGCNRICENLITTDTPVRELMRYLMYYNSYGQKDMARNLFKALPEQTKRNILATDYSKACNACPQKLQIAELMVQAVQKLA